MTLTEKFTALAERLLAKNGEPASLIRRGPSSYDAATDTDTAVTVTIPTRAVLLEVEWNEEDGRKVTRSSATMRVEPLKGDVLVIGEITAVVIRARSEHPQGKPIIWFAEVA